MHVLTKIFVVLVTLLAVMLVPLVVVYAKNEGNYRAKYLERDIALASANQALNSANLSYGKQLEAKESEIKMLAQQVATLNGEVQEKNLAMSRLESDLALTKANQSQLASQIQVLASTGDASMKLTDQLVKEASDLRSESLRITRANAELEEKYRDVNREKEILDAANRSLKEEVQRLSEAERNALLQLAAYESQFGKLNVYAGPGPQGTPIRVTANVVDVRQADGMILVEIDAGQRDGIQKGWELVLGDGNGSYIGKLRIIDVQVNRSVGVAETAAGAPATAVTIGNKAHGFPAN
ncbi:MAG: hypothetical protein ACR2GY_11180 [Phycisphaerales bacterium]